MAIVAAAVSRISSHRVVELGSVMRRSPGQSDQRCGGGHQDRDAGGHERHQGQRDHGPGQRVAYVMLDLEKRGKDIRCFVHGLEQWIIETLDAFNVKGERRSDRVGVWVDRTEPGRPLRENKIAAIGVRVRKWVSFHGIALNVEPDLTHFTGITPCGVSDPSLGVTSLVDLGLPVTIDDADEALKASFHKVFGPTLDVASPSW